MHSPGGVGAGAHPPLGPAWSHDSANRALPRGRAPLPARLPALGHHSLISHRLKKTTHGPRGAGRGCFWGQGLKSAGPEAGGSRPIVTSAVRWTGPTGPVSGWMMSTPASMFPSPEQATHGSRGAGRGGFWGQGLKSAGPEAERSRPIVTSAVMWIGPTGPVSGWMMSAPALVFPSPEKATHGSRGAGRGVLSGAGAEVPAPKPRGLGPSSRGGQVDRADRAVSAHRHFSRQMGRADGAVSAHRHSALRWTVPTVPFRPIVTRRSGRPCRRRRSRG